MGGRRMWVLLRGRGSSPTGDAQRSGIDGMALNILDHIGVDGTDDAGGSWLLRRHVSNGHLQRSRTYHVHLLILG